MTAPDRNTILVGDALARLRELPGECVHSCVTSPPYWGQRAYGAGAEEIGREATPAEYIARLVAVFEEVRRVLRKDGTLWVVMGDGYATGGFTDRRNAPGGSKGREYGRSPRWSPPPGLKPKDLIGLPWMLAFALRDAGWYLRQRIAWTKPNAMPETVTDRCTMSCEDVFLLAKSRRYFFDHEALKEPAGCAAWPGIGEKHAAARDRGEPGGMDAHETRNRRNVWTICTEPYPGDHPAAYPVALALDCIKAGVSAHGVCAACGRPWERNSNGWEQPCAERCGAGAGLARPLVLDPFFGTGVTGIAAAKWGADWLGIELNPKSVKEAHARLAAAGAKNGRLFG